MEGTIIGCSFDPVKRLKQHNAGSVPYTRNLRPWTLLYTEVYEDKHTAYKREWHLKHPKGYLEKKKIIEGVDNPNGRFA